MSAWIDEVSCRALAGQNVNTSRSGSDSAHSIDKMKYLRYQEKKIHQVLLDSFDPLMADICKAGLNDIGDSMRKCISKIIYSDKKVADELLSLADKLDPSNLSIFTRVSYADKNSGLANRLRELANNLSELNQIQDKIRSAI